MSQYQKIVLVDFVHYEMLYALVKVLRPATGELAVFTSEAIAYKLNDRFSGSDSIEIYVGDEADIAYVHEMEK